MADSLDLDRAFESLRRQAVNRPNFIHQRLFDRMAADNVQPAPASSDAEFLRRVTLDSTGRIPTPEAAEAFLTAPTSTNANN
jgi:hypothetical protein